MNNVGTFKFLNACISIGIDAFSALIDAFQKSNTFPLCAFVNNAYFCDVPIVRRHIPPGSFARSDILSKNILNTLSHL